MMPQVKYDVIMAKGGWDQLTPSLSLPPGVVRAGVNFECSTVGGYTRILGYERYDGQPSPSDATYDVLGIPAFDNIPVIGEPVLGSISGATGVICYVGADYIVVTKTVGEFDIPETITSGATTIGLSGAYSVDIRQAAQFYYHAAEIYRSDISAPPGTGAARGAFYFNGSAYVFRDTGTDCLLYKSSSSGWTLVPYGKSVAFTLGTGLISDGDTVVGAVSGATGVVSRVVLETGAWSANAQGRLIFASITGTFQNEVLNVSSVGQATASGAQSSITMDAGGRYEFVKANFYGAETMSRMYGCDGVNPAFEFDGTNLIPINTGMATDNPKHIIAHKSHLFLSYGSSVQHSAIGNPFGWVVADGAGEFGLGDTVTGYLIQPGSQSSSALAILCLNSINLLYGTDTSSWNLTTFNMGSGCLHYTAQNMANSYFLDQRGVIGLQAALNYGNFAQATISHQIRPFIEQNRSAVTASCVSRDRSQYRVHFSNGNGLYCTIVNGQAAGLMPVYYPNPVFNIWEGEDSNGDEIILMCSDNGMVYQMDKGSSFDGASISSYIMLVFNPIGAPRIRKRYRKASVEFFGDAYAEIDFSYQLDYGASYLDQNTSQINVPSNLASAFWDNANWDQFSWDGNTIIPTDCEMVGTGENYAIQIANTSNFIYPFTINSVIVHYTPRRGVR